ncbi:MAG: sodium:proton antiporter NhaD [Bacteroidales bacterium]|nr:sodium:proton antiporter NhaD [Bacteroidales bacterium]
MMEIMVVIFILGYIFIALEHRVGIDKAAIALLTGGILWILYIMISPLSVQTVFPVHFGEFLADNSAVKLLPIIEQCRSYIVDVHVIESLGEISETLFFLMGAMTIVELVDVHGGFYIITDRITTKNKKTLLILIAIITFFMSAILDNLTTSIVMIMMVRKIVPNYKERWVYGSMIIIAANSGGAWSPIGDVTTIMLWIKGKITTGPVVSRLFIPSLISMIIPMLLATKMLKGEVADSSRKAVGHISTILSEKERLILSSLGVLALIMVPFFKYFTHLPPFIGVLTGLSVLWVYTEIIYSRKKSSETLKHRVTRVLKKVDTTTILFFLGILLAVNALQGTGVLNTMGALLEEKVHNIYLINITIGLLSAIVDNVPLVAVAMGMYPLADASMIAAASDPMFIQTFVQDGSFWLFLAYCAGVGGSLLIIGSAAGVVVMGIEKISFNWYLKNFSLLALAGYLSGAAAFALMDLL